MSVLLIFSVSAASAWLVYSQRKARQCTKSPRVAYIDLEGDRSLGRYVAETGNLIAKGYAQVIRSYVTEMCSLMLTHTKHSKKGQHLSIPNLSDFNSPLVVLLVQCLNEVVVALQSELSLKEYFSKVCSLPLACG